jgi:hypothetical protein
MRLGCAVRVESTEQDSTTSLGTSLAGGCYLGVPHERYLWWVHVTRRGPGVECLRGTKPWDGRCYFSTGHRMPRRARHRLARREDVLFDHYKDWYSLRTRS